MTLKRNKGLKRRKYKPRVLKTWPDTRKVAYELSHGRCSHCGKAMALVEAQIAHMHGLGRGRNRDKPDAECSLCGIPLNKQYNLLCVCPVGHVEWDRIRRRADGMAVAQKGDVPEWWLRTYRLCRKDLYRSEDFKAELAEWEK